MGLTVDEEFEIEKYVGTAAGTGAGHGGQGAEACGETSASGGQGGLGVAGMPNMFGSGGGAGSFPDGGGRGGGRVSIRWAGRYVVLMLGRCDHGD